MKKLSRYVKEYFQNLNKTLFLSSTLFTAVLIFSNYHWRLNRAIYRLPDAAQYPGWYVVFLLAFSFAYLLHELILKSQLFKNGRFLILLFIAPAIFAWKMSFAPEFNFATDVFKNEYWNAVVYWPLKVVIITGLLFLVYRLFDNEHPFYGVTIRSFSLLPYLGMLLIMLPLIAVAATQKDFLSMYPRMQNIAYLLQPNKGLEKLLYEISYGSDFFSIELFFRGFLVLGFARWAGKGAILPMAIFYCTIHFGKPLGECISSYFGGLILGIVAYHTRSVLGGFIVHVGIAWLMEAAGYLQHSFPAS